MSLVKRIVGILVPLALLATLASWAIASPVGATPDEDYHLASIWCGQGIRDGICEEAATEERRSVPLRLTLAARCYAFDPQASAACELPADSVLRATHRGDFTGDYPPVYYWTMGLFVGPDVAASVIAMRLFNALLFVGLATALCLLLPRRWRGILLWGVAITIVPFGLFLIPSVNPSSWSITSAVLLLPALLGLASTESMRKRIGFSAIILVAAVIGSGARSDSAAYTALAGVVALILTARRSRSTAVIAGAAVVLAVIGAAFFLASGQSGVVDPVADARNPEAGPGELLFTNLTLLPSLWVGSLGTWGLGWLDTALPPVVWVSVLTAFAALVFAGLRSLHWRRAAALLLIGAALVAVPMYVLTNEQIFVGAGVQPRYVYPLLIMFAMVALLGLSSRRAGMSPIQSAVVVALIAVAASIALHTNMRRYVVGTDVKGLNLNIGLEWWWNLPFGPMVVWAIGSAGIAFALVGAAWVLTAGEEPDGVLRRDVWPPALQPTPALRAAKVAE